MTAQQVLDNVTARLEAAGHRDTCANCEDGWTYDCLLVEMTEAEYAIESGTEAHSGVNSFTLDNTSGYSQEELNFLNCVLAQLRTRAFGGYVIGTSGETDELIAQSEKYWMERILARYDSGTTTVSGLLDVIA